jgi:hypothetical protein
MGNVLTAHRTAVRLKSGATVGERVRVKRAAPIQARKFFSLIVLKHHVSTVVSLSSQVGAPSEGSVRR